MPWRIVDRRIGRAGGRKRRHAKQRQWDRDHGEGCWEVGYVIEGAFVPQHEALDRVYYASYAEHLDTHPDDLETLVHTAKVLRNPHAEATTGVDLQVPAIMRYMRERGLVFQGDAVVDIGSWKGQRSHAVSDRLSPLHVRCCVAPSLTLEAFWQSRKCLAVWEDD